MKNNILKFYMVAFYLCSTFVLFADPGTTDTDGTMESTDTPMPIDDYVWVMALIGLIFVFMKLKTIQSKKIADK